MKKYIINNVKDEMYVKLRFQSFKEEDYNYKTNYVIVLNERILKSKTFKDLIENQIIREENSDLAYVDNVKLEVGKEYYFRYRYSKEWKKYKVTKFTSDGFPWAGTGIITDGLWYVDEVENDTLLKEFARKWLSENNVSEKTLGEIFVEMYNSYKNK